MSQDKICIESGCGAAAMVGRKKCAPHFNAGRTASVLSEPTVDPGMLPFGSPMQRSAAEALLEHGSVEAAATALGLTPRQLRAHCSELGRKAAARGYAPGSDMSKPTPEGYSVKGVSTLYDAEGNVRQQWVKTKKDDDSYTALFDAWAAAIEPSRGLAEPVPSPKHMDADLLAFYPIGDAHIGLLTWAPETGTNFNIKIAEQNLYAAIDRLVSLAPNAEQALIANMGDWYHADSRQSTTTGGTYVDCDSRWSNMMRVGVLIMRRLIDRALQKHARVKVINVIGNHDYHGSVMLSIALAQFYENEPRVEIECSPAKFHYHVFGLNLIGFTHGDTTKMNELGQIMACDRAEDWGRTKFRWFMCGHVHHQNIKELHGCTVETFNTLAPGDAWHRASGYRSMQNSKLIVFHKKYGQINRHVVGIDQLEND